MGRDAEPVQDRVGVRGLVRGHMDKASRKPQEPWVWEQQGGIVSD